MNQPRLTMHRMWPEADKTEELLSAARRGESRAINRLLERHRSAVRRLVQMRLDQRIQRRVDVSDVVQDVFVEANRRLRQYLNNPAMPFHLWLRHIARDRIVDAHRRHRVSAKRSIDREQAMVAPAGMDRSTRELAAQLCDQQLTPAAAATQKELTRRVEQAITRLSDQDAEIILMRHYEQLTNQEAALALELSEPAASMRYLRAIRRLRALLFDPASDAPAAGEAP
jgi:RNA polymerase sigma-70 factor (ECF subfamily)